VGHHLGRSLLALHCDVADRGLGKEKQMTLTIDESAIALWPWAAGVAYLLIGVLVARWSYRQKFAADDPEFVAFWCGIFWILAIPLAVIIGVILLIAFVITFRNGTNR
jgi:hypothetical protein